MPCLRQLTAWAEAHPPGDAGVFGSLTGHVGDRRYGFHHSSRKAVASMMTPA